MYSGTLIYEVKHPIFGVSKLFQDLATAADFTLAGLAQRLKMAVKASQPTHGRSFVQTKAGTFEF